jgi:hypothetical protein
MEERERAGIDRIAAQLGTRKAGAIEEEHARAAAGQDRGGNRAGRTCSRDNGIEHDQTAPITIAEFFEPKPRQLHSAAAGDAGRPAFGM